MTGSLNEPSVLLVVHWPVGGIRTFLRYTYNCPPLNKSQYGLVVASNGEIAALRNDFTERDVTFFVCDQKWRVFFRVITDALSRNRYNIIHSHGLTSAVYSYLPARMYRVKHVITLHDTFNDNLFSGIRGRLKHRMLAHVLASADAIHCVSNDVYNNLLEYFPRLNSSKLACIRSGIRVEQFAAGPTRNIRTELGLSHNHFLIGFFGRFMAPKGFRYLVDAIRILSESNSLQKYPVVVAFGWGGYIREDQAYIDKLGISDHFRFLPLVQDVASSLRGVDIVAMPSLHEACGLLAMEAMVAGLPVIGTSCIGLREILERTPASIVPPANAQALAETLIAHIDAPGAAAKTAAAFATEAADRFDIRTAASKLCYLYQNLREH